MNRQKPQNPTRFLCEMGMIAALYAVLTLALAPISFGQVQFRVAEALCVLPFFTPAAVPGLFAGCVMANVFGSSLGLLDIVVGSLATLAAAALAGKVRQKWLAPLPAVAVNAFAVAFVLYAELGLPYWLNVAYVALGQTAACYALGMPLLFVLDKYKSYIFRRA